MTAAEIATFSILLLAAAGAALAAETTVDGPNKTRDGTLLYTVTSEYLAGPTEVEVLLPDVLEEGKRYPVLYILPVHPGRGGPGGSGILEAQRRNVPNRHGLLCVAHTFDSMPWYADHPTNPKVRQESHFLKVVLPLIESRYPVLKQPAGRLLIGFSKSGWGAFSLLLRHPDLFGRAAAWDSPLMQSAPNRWGMEDVFATPENFEAYKVSALIEQRAGLLRKSPPRLVLMGYGVHGTNVEQMHKKLADLRIAHHYDNATKRTHDWHSGWFADAVKYLTLPEGPAAPAVSP
jgi:esterase/lipase superfamily enzyme